MADTDFVFTGYGCPEDLLPWNAWTATPSTEEEDWNGKILGYGPAALSEIFSRIARYGITKIRTMREERFDELFGDVKCDDASVEQVINSLRFLRDPTLDIDSLHEETDTKIDEHWIAFIPDQMLTERYMKNFKGSAYFDLWAEKRQPAVREIIAAWFEDLANGLQTGCRSYVHATFDSESANLPGYQSDLDFAKLVIEHDLVKHLDAIPHPMLVRANLYVTKCYVSRLQKGCSVDDL